MTPAEIETLYPLAIAGDAAARDRLSDAAGLRCGMARGSHEDIVRHPERWYFPVTDRMECYGLSYTESAQVELWNHHGRLAPLVSGDCSDSVPMPVGYDWGKSGRRNDDGTLDGTLIAYISVYIWRGDKWEMIATFDYGDDAHRWAAETAARAVVNSDYYAGAFPDLRAALAKLEGK